MKDYKDYKDWKAIAEKIKILLHLAYDKGFRQINSYRFNRWVKSEIAALEQESKTPTEMVREAFEPIQLKTNKL